QPKYGGSSQTTWRHNNDRQRPLLEPSLFSVAFATRPIDLRLHPHEFVTGSAGSRRRDGFPSECLCLSRSTLTSGDILSQLQLRGPTNPRQAARPRPFPTSLS